MGYPLGVELAVHRCGQWKQLRHMYRVAKERVKGEHIKKNTASAVEWIIRSAESGNLYALYMLGKLYLTGKGNSLR